MKFTSEIVKTANKIYKGFKDAGQISKENWRHLKSEAYKRCFAYVKSVVSGVVEFTKLSGEYVCRKIDYVSKFTQYSDFDKGRFFAWDLEAKKIISFYPWQLG
jgi:hypothetical protein